MLPSASPIGHIFEISGIPFLEGYMIDIPFSRKGHMKFGLLDNQRRCNVEGQVSNHVKTGRLVFPVRRLGHLLRFENYSFFAK